MPPARQSPIIDRSSLPTVGSSSESYDEFDVEPKIADDFAPHPSTVSSDESVQTILLRISLSSSSGPARSTSYPMSCAARMAFPTSIHAASPFPLASSKTHKTASACRDCRAKTPLGARWRAERAARAQVSAGVGGGERYRE